MVSVWQHLPDTYQTLTCRSRALARTLPTAYREPDEVTRRHGVTAKTMYNRLFSTDKTKILRRKVTLFEKNHYICTLISQHRWYP